MGSASLASILSLGFLATPQTYRCADLDVVLAHGIAVVHGVEGGDLVDTHGRHLEDARNLVHDADAAEAVLALAEVEQRHDGGLFVLRGVSRDDFLDELLILRREREGDLGVVLRRVAVLERALAHVWLCSHFLPPNARWIVCVCVCEKVN